MKFFDPFREDTSMNHSKPHFFGDSTGHAMPVPQGVKRDRFGTLACEVRNDLAMSQAIPARKP